MASTVRSTSTEGASPSPTMPWSVSTSTMILEAPGYRPPVHQNGASSGMLTGVALRPVIFMVHLPFAASGRPSIGVAAGYWRG